ncbi:unnamed protein product, partial [Iphiclides podalirius]
MDVWTLTNTPAKWVRVEAWAEEITKPAAAISPLKETHARGIIDRGNKARYPGNRPRLALQMSRALLRGPRGGRPPNSALIRQARLRPKRKTNRGTRKVTSATRLPFFGFEY